MDWISVKDKLPEDDVKVLCLIVGWDDYPLSLNGTPEIVGGAFNRKWGWSKSFGCQFSPVTHWMPLPKFPEEYKCDGS